jgi:hypothetical protein
MCGPSSLAFRLNAIVAGSGSFLAEVTQVCTTLEDARQSPLARDPIFAGERPSLLASSSPANTL